MREVQVRGDAAAKKTVRQAVTKSAYMRFERLWLDLQTEPLRQTVEDTRTGAERARLVWPSANRHEPGEHGADVHWQRRFHERLGKTV